MDPRIIRDTYGVTARTKVNDGKTNTIGLLHAKVPGSTNAIAGKIWKTFVASKKTTKIATTNSGSAARINVRREVTLSKSFPLLTAA